MAEGTGLGRPEHADQNPPLALRVALFFLLVCINALVAKFAVFTFTLAPGISSLYLVVAFMIVFTLWFGMWGACAAYAGCYIGAGLLSGIPPDVSLYWSVADFLQVLIPLVAFRSFKADPAIRSQHDLVILLVFGIVLNNICGAIWGPATLAAGGIIPPGTMVTAAVYWFLGNSIVCIALVPALLYIFTPAVRAHELYVQRYWQ